MKNILQVYKKGYLEHSAQLLADIIKLCYTINTKTKIDVFVNYFGNTDGITINAHSNGWSSGVCPDITVIENTNVNCEKELEQAKMKLEEIYASEVSQNGKNSD